MSKPLIPELDAMRVDAEPMAAVLAIPLSRFGHEIVAANFSRGHVVSSTMLTAHNDSVGNDSFAHDAQNPRAIVPEMLIASRWERLLAVPVPEIDGYDRHHLMPTDMEFYCPVKVGDRLHLRVKSTQAGLSRRGDPAMFLTFSISADRLVKKATEPDKPDERDEFLVAEGKVELRFVAAVD